MGNIKARVVRSEVVDGVMSFEKEAALHLTVASRHIYGSIRFLPAPYSSFQLIRGSAEAPGEPLIRQIAAVVNSWKSM